MALHCQTAKEAGHFCDVMACAGGASACTAGDRPGACLFFESDAHRMLMSCLALRSSGGSTLICWSQAVYLAVPMQAATLRWLIGLCATQEDAVLKVSSTCAHCPFFRASLAGLHDSKFSRQLWLCQSIPGPAWLLGESLVIPTWYSAAAFGCLLGCRPSLSSCYAAGICGSDLHLYDSFLPSNNFPIIPLSGVATLLPLYSLTYSYSLQFHVSDAQERFFPGFQRKCAPDAVARCTCCMGASNRQHGLRMHAGTWGPCPA